MDEPDKDFMIVALDLLSSIVQALNKEAKPLVDSTEPPVVSFLSVCVQDRVPEVRQSAYALLGDLAISCFEHIQPSAPQFMELLINQVDPTAEHVSVCNNATWAAGEIALQWGPGIKPFTEPLLKRLFPLIVKQDIQRTLLENVAITVGRLGLVDAETVAPHLEHFILPWLAALVPIRDNGEKESAYAGLCEMIRVNPNGGVNSLGNLISAIAKYKSPPTPLATTFQNILLGYKQMVDNTAFEQIIVSLPKEETEFLSRHYPAILG